jgi:hypothetical protein
LPIYKRGVIDLNQNELNSIFDASCKDFYDGFVNQRAGRMEAPYFRTKSQKLLTGSSGNYLGKTNMTHLKLPGFEDE